MNSDLKLKLAETIGIRELYTQLKKRAKDKESSYSLIDLIVRLREGIKKPHSGVILCLFWLHLLLTDKPLYDRLKSSSDEAGMRQILGGKVMSTYVQGEKMITVCSDMFPPDFFAIVDAYIDFTDELNTDT